MKMLDFLREAERALPRLLQDESLWQDIDVNYHPPRVERLWTPLGEGKIFLHEIHPCEASAALLHPHPWPSAMLLLDGQYEMGYARGVAGQRPADVQRRLVGAGEIYVMESPDEWHFVAPLGQAVKSLMVIGPSWRNAIKTKPVTSGLAHLEPGRRRQLLSAFRAYFPAG